MLQAILMVLGTALLPVLEIRGAIPVGIAWDLPLPLTYVLGVAGNMLPIPFVIIFLRKLMAFCYHHVQFLRVLLDKFEARILKKQTAVERYGALGLFILVAIPLPGTGAWTGAAVAALLNMRLSKALLPILLGVMTAGGIVLLVSLGVVKVFQG